MVLKGCSGVSRDKFLSKSEKEHKAYCESRKGPYHPFKACLNAEGCKYEHKYGGMIGGITGGGTCKLNMGGSLSNAYINGGFGFGKLCLSREFTRLILLILFPPFYVFLNEKENGFKNKGAIVMSFIMTCFFYFPGLIHGLMYKHRRNQY